MAKRMLADVLWEAANAHLSESSDYPCHMTYSCCAVGAALGLDYVASWGDVEDHPAMAFLRDLGCDTDSLDGLHDFPGGEERQGVRYMWLLLAMHVAESEGITV